MQPSNSRRQFLHARASARLFDYRRQKLPIVFLFCFYLSGERQKKKRLFLVLFVSTRVISIV